MAIYALAVTLLLVPCLALASDTVGERFDVKYDRKTFKLINVTDTPRYCMDPPSVRSENSNRDNFINSDLRFALCKLSYEDAGKQFDSNFARVCFEDSGHILTRWNPCALICMEKSKLSNERNSEDCDSSNQQENTFLLTDFPCGENHLCDSNGCCREKADITKPSEPSTTVVTSTVTSTQPLTTITDDPTTAQTPTTPTSTTLQTNNTPTIDDGGSTPGIADNGTTTSQPDPETTTRIATTPSSQTETQTTTEPVDATTTPTQPTTLEPPTDEPTTHKPHKKYTCDNQGYFVDKENPKFYYHCKFFATIHSCLSDEKFDFSINQCVYDQKIEEPALDFTKWKHALKCPQIGVNMKSPYDCRYFYSCEPHNNGGYRFYFHRCFGGLIFNESSQSCDFKTHRCNNVLVLPDDVAQQAL